MKVEGRRVSQREVQRPCTTGPEDGKRSHSPKIMGGLWKLEKARKQIPPLEFLKEASLPILDASTGRPVPDLYLPNGG